MRVLCEQLRADGTRRIDVVGENENAEELQFRFLTAGIDVNDVLGEIDRVLIANLLYQHNDERARKRQGSWMSVHRLGQHAARLVEHVHISQRPGEIDGELFSAGSVSKQDHDVDEGAAIEQILAEAFKSDRRLRIDGKCLAPLLLGFMAFAVLVKNESQHQVWLDDLGIELHSLFKFRQSVRRLVAVYQSKARKIVQLR